MSSEKDGSGRLYVVATPIGNLDDISARAIDVLRSVDAIAAEDTRRTRKLLSRYEIGTPLVSHHEHNEDRAARRVVERILGGHSVALVSDAGTPLISDPGYRLVRLAADEGIDVVAVPGPSAVTAALSVSGLPPLPFRFEGFLPRKKAARRRKLESLAGERATLIFYVSPHRVGAVLSDLVETLGDRPAALARELTKIHEEVRRAPLSELLDGAAERPPRGEIVVVVQGERSE
ncbi:MAG: 16S rRNA (cytidine(1402)-2'-O)-methyltransferase [Candidatus Eisenbacteria bacterium]|nr:16S rRNA (cytidine(1402)-2'-O)-methyltransferase [Candidatus Eisenbacteria bacterium]